MSYKNFLILLLLLNLIRPVKASESSSFFEDIISKNKILTAYDEVHDEDGSIRGTYQIFDEMIGKLTLEDKDKFLKDSHTLFRQDNSLVYFPRFIKEHDLLSLRIGVSQRGRAIKAFLNDHYHSSERVPEYIEKNIIPKSVIDSILVRSNEELLVGKINPHQISFWYGPDVIRGGDGNFYVIEDNQGYVGGFGDLKIAREIFLNLFPDKNFINLIDEKCDPNIFYQQLVESYRRRSVDNGAIVMINYPRNLVSDHEDARLKKILGDFGIHLLTLPINKKKGDQRLPQLAIKKDKAFIKYKKGNQIIEERVGLVIIDAESIDLDPKAPEVFQKQSLIILDEMRASFDAQLDSLEKSKTKLKLKLKKREDLKAKIKVIDDFLKSKNKNIKISELRTFLKRNFSMALKSFMNQGFPKFFEAQKKGSFNVVNGLGIEAIGDKEFYLYVEKMISFYLQEIPILKNLPTKSFRIFEKNNQEEEEILDKDLLDLVFRNDGENRDFFVVKRVDGRGGNSVWVGPKISAVEFCSVKNDIIKEPGAFIVQLYTPLSEAYGHILDLRILSEVSDDQVITSPVPWGRAISKEGSNGKVNLSDKGAETAVFLRK